MSMHTPTASERADWNSGNSAMLEPSSRLRFGVVCVGTQLAAWQADCLERLMALEQVDLGLALIPESMGADDSEGNPRGRLWRLPWRLFYTYHLLPRSRSAQPTNWSAILTRAPQIRFALETEDGIATLSPEIVSQVAEYELDILLWLCPGRPQGDILDAARYGVWGFRYGQEVRHGAFPPGLSAILRGEPITTASLRRFGPQGSITVLKQGAIGTISSSFPANLDAVRTLTTPWPAQVCLDILHGLAIESRDTPSDQRESAEHAPDWLDLLRLALRVGASRLADLYQAYGTFWEWTIGIVDQPIEAYLDAGAPPPVHWLSLPGERTFWADPFALARDEGLHLFFEDYDYEDHRGRISTVYWSAAAQGTPQVVIDEAWHLSYPYLIEDSGQVYCIPESCENDEIALYRAERLPDRWTKVATLVEGFAGTDATVFWHDDRWWMLACDSSEGLDHALYAWHAEDLLGPWTAHGNNPIKVDVRSSRPAGTPFIHQDRLYRPAQDCSESYGSRVVINRIERLDEYAFEEETVALVEPNRDGPYPDGLHTLSSVGEWTLVDGLKNVPVVTRPGMIVHGLGGVLRRGLSRLSRRTAR